jgi:hypothetical protein
MVKKIFWILCVLATLAQAAPAPQRFYPDDPVWVDPDNTAPVGDPQAFHNSEMYDFFRNTIFGAAKTANPVRAANTNTVDEVPDSSWFQNRHGKQRLTSEQLTRGPNTTDGPSMDGPWIVVSTKGEGASPGFRIRDARSDEYLLKLDTAGYPEMASAAEVIATKFFYAAGYHVPENYLVYFDAGRLQLDPAAKTETAGGGKRRMDSADLNRILERSYHDSQGRYRAVASKVLTGRPLGPFRYYGTRPDDPNDIFDHENRRELRGLRVIASWLNHDDVRPANTLDMLVEADGHRYVRHYLIDFGSTFGSGTTKPTDPRTGHEYFLEGESSMRRLATLGIWQPDWTKITYPDFTALGRFEADHFDPGEWKPEYPNAAFDNMRPDDAYWAARIVMAFTDDDIRAIVRTGGLSDAAAEEYLVETLIKRRDKIGRHWLAAINSADHFVIRDDHLSFECLSAIYGLGPQPADYVVRWFEYDNEHEVRMSSWTVSASTSTPTSISLQIPSRFTNANFRGYYGAEIMAASGTVVVFMRKSSPPIAEIVAVQRSPY